MAESLDTQQNSTGKNFSIKRVLKAVFIIIGIVVLFFVLKIFIPPFAAILHFMVNPPAEKGWSDN